MIIADGLHPAIIDWETWELAQKRFANNPPVKHSTTLKNPFTGILYCSKCGTAMCLQQHKNANTRISCRRVAPRCYKSANYLELYNAIVFALENSELPSLKLKVETGEGEAAKIQKNLLAKFEKELEGYRAQEDKQFELLENGTYSQEVFDRRHRIICEKIEYCQKQIIETKLNMPKDIDYSERVTTLENAIALLKDPNATPAQQNRILKSIVSRIEFSGEESQGPGYHISPTSNLSLEVTLLI
jgi:ssDNA-binding Zn-finger/Zn-ribbon topoisomerase 1